MYAALHHFALIMALVLAFTGASVLAAAVPSRPGLAARADPTDSAAASAPATDAVSSSDATSASFVPTAVRPTTGYTATQTVTVVNGSPQPTSMALNASQDVFFARAVGWYPLSVIPTNGTSCPGHFETATPTYTEILSTQVADPRHALGCCAGVYIRRDNPYRPDNFTAILNGTRDDGCFAGNAFQLLELPYGVRLADYGLQLTPDPYSYFPIATVTVTKKGKAGTANSLSSPLSLRSISGGLVLFTSVTCLVGAAVVLL